MRGPSTCRGRKGFPRPRNKQTVSLYRLARTVADASGDGAVDWGAVTAGAKAAAKPGSLDLTVAEHEGYAMDVREARERVREVADIPFELPGTVEVHHRHHWIDANVSKFERVMRPLESKARTFPGAARTVNTGTMAVMLSFLANNVLGQYDPLLLADTVPDDAASPEADASQASAGHALYFVHPNIQTVARALAVDNARFRRWIVFHEVTHAAEFGAAPWLGPHLETRMARAVDELADGSLDRGAILELDVTMTAIEGYAELVMDRAFDAEYADLRAKLEARRRGHGPLARLVRRLLGLGMKRRQYERGKAFFDTVAGARGVAAAGRVWDRPENLPSDDELDEPDRWLARVGP